MNKIFCVAAVASTLLVGCSKQEVETETSTAGENPLNAPADYLGAINQAQKTAVRTVDSAAIKSAIDMFQVQEGRLPTDLNELVSKKYLPALPQPPAGSEIQYDPKTGKVEITR